MKRVYDVIVYGATGFTGKLVVEYFCNHAPKELRWAICGRDEAKLKDLQKLVLLSGKTTCDVIVATTDQLQLVVTQARVVISGVGPYWKKGEPVARACVAARTHYLDYTGEALFVKAITDELHQEAIKNNVLVLSCCGFDSVPADVGAFFLADATRKKLSTSADFSRISSVVEVTNAGASGGTLASIIQLIEQGDLKAMSDPYFLNVGNRGPPERDVMFVNKNSALGLWTSPFLMAAINVRIVRKAESLLHGGFGTPFHSKGSFVVTKKGGNLIVLLVDSAP
jgi:short subunit dehydrogenase-like uncharacterized protein